MALKFYRSLVHFLNDKSFLKMSIGCFISVKLMLMNRFCFYFVWPVFYKLFNKQQL